MAEGSWRRLLGARGIRGADYEAHFESLAASGQDVHGEAGFVETLDVRSVLDAGCGTGRVARELARRGFEVVGVDSDPEMIETARQKAPHLDWRLDDLARMKLGRTFDVAVMAGNVMLFVARGTAGAVVVNLARHLAPGGLLVAGFQLFPSRLNLEQYDALAESAGLELRERWGTWDRGAWTPGGDYAVSVHRRLGSVDSPSIRTPTVREAARCNYCLTVEEHRAASLTVGVRIGGAAFDRSRASPYADPTAQRFWRLYGHAAVGRLECVLSCHWWWPAEDRTRGGRVPVWAER